MRFTIDKEQFLKGLSIAGRAVPSSANLPALLCFKLSLSSKGLEIVASNNDVSIWTVVPHSVNEREIIRNSLPGQALINAKVLTEVIRKSGGEEISFEIIDDSIAKIEDGNSAYRLTCSDVEEYPEIDTESQGIPFTVPCSEVAALVEQTAFAASNKDARAALTAVNLKAENGKLIATATDSARLSRKSIDVDPSVRFSTNIPAKNLSEIVRLFDDATDVEITPSAEKIVFAFGQTIASSRLISEDYPVKGQIIPTNFNYFLRVNSAQLLNALERVSILTAASRASVVALTMDDEGVEVSANGDQVGSGNERLQMAEFNGDRLQISFNSVYVAQAVRALGSEEVTMQFIGEMKPFVVRNPHDDSVVELITPMRTR